ncbi:MaoC family dehydratase [Microbulbifer spongiae]|uniref:MaoC family dehydratase n=1 Tax=Microbulbifer spongiae TaxID=2944933 RepID=A0ABY9E7N2_9GAMM|nr:MaoC family dehydratase [Microbulbifer sp. MI-G]WKD49018.1 MaoC family dehydratase [Microbulbifer sp. MI-G]
MIRVEQPRDLLQQVGRSLGATEWMAISQERINQFAQASEDHQWIHVDPERAAKGPFGDCIAHGYLILSLANKFLPELLLVKTYSLGLNYGCDKIRFPNSVKVAQRIRGVGELISGEAKPGCVQVVVRIVVEIEDEERPACVVDTISRFYD